MFCTQCGKKLPDDTKFCIYCGAKVASPVPGVCPENDIVSKEKPVADTPTAEPVFSESAESETVCEVSSNPASDETENEQCEPEKTEPIYVSDVIAPAEKPKKKKKTLLFVILGIVGAVILAIIIFLVCTKDQRAAYKLGKQYMTEGNYYAAEEQFEGIKGFFDSDKYYEESFTKARYNDAVSRIATKTTENAEISKQLLSEIGDYEDSKELLEECDKIIEYNEAVEIYESGEYDTAKEHFEALGDYSDSKGMVVLCDKHKLYDKAVGYRENEDYSLAKKTFKEVGEYFDAPEQYDYCVNMEEYLAAIKLYEDKNYESARAKFASLGDFEESEKYVEWCDLVPLYEEAMEKFNNEDYTGAKELFAKCKEKNFSDSASYYSKCVTYENSKTEYEKAMKLYNEGKYYSAKQIFDSISGYKDSASKSASCVRSRPSSGEIYHNSSYKSSSVSLKIKGPSGYDTFLHIYSGGTLVSTVYLRKGGSATVYIPSGTYTIDADYGNTWYGTTETFGPNGSYTTLLNGSSTYFTLSAGYDYTLQLLASTSGNVGSKSRSWKS